MYAPPTASKPLTVARFFGCGSAALRNPFAITPDCNPQRIQAWRMARGGQ